jgi:serine protease Do
VAKDSPAAEAGLRPGDVITALDDAAVRRDIDYYFALLEASPTRPIRVKYERDGQAEETSLKVKVAPEPDGRKLALELFGLELARPTQRQAREFGLRENRGLMVVGVQQGGPAQELGVEPGDVLVQIGRYPLSGLKQVGRILESVKSGEGLDVSFLRPEGSRLFLIEATLVAR